VTEDILREFFVGKVTAAQVARDVSGSVERHVTSEGTIISRVRIRDMAANFALTSRHLLMLLDAVASGELSVEALDAVCFCIEASQRFDWNADKPGSDGERVSEALFLLGSQEVNYPLTPTVLAKVRHYLLTGENTLDSTDKRPRGPRPHLLSETRKVFDPGV
jgi:hypothetical protein